MTDNNCNGTAIPRQNAAARAKSLADICLAAREAGRNALFLPTIEAINRNWVTARELWLDSHMPEPCGMSDEQYGAALDRVASAFEQGVDDLYRCLEENVGHG
ncbi:hypothetical protein [Caballeronia sp. dw_276]|uniref:hypothetical protein n=1 Tax=Caballeronia sp. dw_276 TaxID=2719795 RepID=UPI001BD2CDE8|nr:hypothetical protein [Caballeronia sp. dw_276]